ncbi:MAG: glycosyltransferase family 2 protein [Bacteriovoracaceae bacterium]|nr:glycosyltransferase family 2 protein [Bacteriovoracaceae bacterium]
MKLGPLHKKCITIGVPVFNEEEGIVEFLNQIESVVSDIKQTYSNLSVGLQFINDGSWDQTEEILKNYQSKNLDFIKIKSFSANFGHPAAISAIYDIFDADALILMDSDLQDEPKVLSSLIYKWLSGADCVRVVRGSRGEGWVFKLGAKIFYTFYEKLSGLKGNIGIFGLYDKKVVHALKSYPERMRYIPGLISTVGFKTDYIVSDRNSRFTSESKVGWIRLIRLAIVGALSFSHIPIHLITSLGFIVSIISFLLCIAVVGTKLFTDMAIPGWASFMTTQFFFGGVIILCLGVIGQYVAIIHQEVKNRPLYIWRDSENEKQLEEREFKERKSS